MEMLQHPSGFSGCYFDDGFSLAHSFAAVEKNVLNRFIAFRVVEVGEFTCFYLVRCINFGWLLHGNPN